MGLLTRVARASSDNVQNVNSPTIGLGPKIQAFTHSSTIGLAANIQATGGGLEGNVQNVNSTSSNRIGLGPKIQATAAASSTIGLGAKIQAFTVGSYAGGFSSEIPRANLVKEGSFAWLRSLFEGVQEAASHVYTNLTEGFSKLSQVDPVMAIAGTMLVAGLVCSTWNKTEIQQIDPINKDQRIYELVLRVNETRRQLQHQSDKVKNLSSMILPHTPLASGSPALKLAQTLTSIPPAMGL